MVNRRAARPTRRFTFSFDLMQSRFTRVAWATDLHLDHASRISRVEMLDALSRADADLLLLTGDTGTALTVAGHLSQIAEAFPGLVAFVLGNHDAYGSGIERVRAEVRALARVTPNLTYLHDGAVLPLPGGGSVIGCDGWGDARYGNWSGTGVYLNDFRLIDELAYSVSRPLLVERLRGLGDESAARLRDAVARALLLEGHVLIATHVPPFDSAAWHDGAISDESHTPYFACKATGDVLLEAATARPERDFTVLCGHTHGSGECWPLPNLHVVTGGSVYGKPVLQPFPQVGESRPRRNRR
jgi:3',5'-cyclic-AMP phosphodiesterase